MTASELRFLGYHVAHIEAYYDYLRSRRMSRERAALARSWN